MKSLLKKILFLIPRELITQIFVHKFPNVILSYSQNGEDIILQHYFANKIGTYIDVGAHHPERFSNTFALYKRGWSGINIDPKEGMKELFSERVRDINLEIGISDKPGYMKYHVYEKTPLNTFNESTVEEHKKENIHPINTVDVPVKTLKEIVNTHMNGKKLDFLNIDVEGFELNVLQSHDWSLPPEIIAVEDHNVDMTNLEQSAIYNFLHAKGYNLFTKANYTSMYKKI